MLLLQKLTKLARLTFLVTASLLIAGGQRSIAQDAPAKEAPPADEAAPDKEPADSPDVYAVPEGNDSQKLQEFLTQLTQTPAQDQSRAGIRNHLSQIHDASQKVFQRDVDDETRMLAVALISDSLTILEQYGDREAPAKKAKFIEELKKSQNPALATRGRLLEVAGQIAKMDPADKASVKGVIDLVAKTLADKPLTIQHAQLAYSTVSILEQLDDPKLVDMAAKAFAPPLKASDDPDLKGLGDTLEGTARRLNLKGNNLKLTGKTVAGEEFNVDQWKGKVVIVDFWATWCGPCIAELPNLQALYDEQHENGLEVVGISLDDSRPVLEEFLKKREIPWPTIFIDPQGGDSWNNPIATYYGVASIPTMFLVGRDGKVVATDLYGEDLQQMALELLKKE